MTLSQCLRTSVLVAIVLAARGVDDDSADLSFLKTALDEATAVGDFEQYVASGGVVAREAGREAVEHAMEHSWWELSTKIVRVAEESFDVDLSSTVHQTGSRIRARLQALSDALHKTAPGAAGIPPAFEWAQSPDTVLLNLKFAHKIDTPATLGCEVTPANVELTPLALRLRADCREKHKAFDLQLSLHSEIDPVASSWSLTSVGRALVTLKKATNATWPRLLKGGKKPPHMHVWWAMREKYEAENEAFDKKTREAAKAAAAAPNASATAPSPSPEAAGGDDAPAAATDAAAANTSENDDGEADGAAATPSAAPSAAAAAAPSADPAAARARRALERELRAVDAAERAELQAIEQEARSAKMAIDAAARTDKTRADATAQSKREALAASKAAERDAIRRRHAGGGGEDLQAAEEPLMIAGNDPAAAENEAGASGEL